MDLLTTNYGSSDDENAQNFCGSSNRHKEVLLDNEDSSVEQNDELSEYELHFGRTPPRTRILRRNRERKQRDENNHLWNGQSLSNKRVLRRRNTISNTFDDLMSRADNNDSDQGKRTNKRTLKLLRGSERDLKLDITSAQHNANSTVGQDVPKTSHLFTHVEGVRRFMSLCSRRVCHSKPHVVITKKDEETPPDDNDRSTENSTKCPQTRVEFHKTLALLVRMGCGDKPTHERSTRRHISREEYLWQNELKDIIWLELQAWHADRSPIEQDDYLCISRGSVVNILDDIMTYQFSRHKQDLSAQSSDSGVEEDCQGCFSVICQSCMEAQNEGLKDIEKLMNRLEAAELLFPSSKAFGEFFPTYNSTEFVGRVKAMCLWYNMTRHQLLKIVILGRMLTLEDRYIGPSNLFLDPACSVESTSPSDSNSSTSSLNDFLSLNGSIVLSSINNLIKKDSNSKSPFRGYIENMLKTRALSKSLNFLERLDRHLLRKAKITLSKPHNETVFEKIPTDNEDEELLRYGSWSPEGRALALPSYKSIFVFLSCVPLDVIQEFLCMRLEQKPENPSPLSIRQLLRELKEGIRLATNYRQRVLDYIHSALSTDEIHISIENKLMNFDKTLLEIVKLYLEYLEQWALLYHDTFQQSLLEDEWKFCIDVVTLIPSGIEAAGMKFCTILNSMLDASGERLLNRIDESAVLLRNYHDDTNLRQCLFTVCRELQQCFNDERERCIKTVAFTKNIFKTEKIPKEYLTELKKSVITFKCRIPNAIEKVQAICDVSAFKEQDDMEKTSLTTRCREILLQGYRFGFDYYKVMSDLVPAHRKESIARSMVQFSHLWMTFVRERCDRGRGMRPRWAYQGLEFLLVVCDPQHTMYLTEEEFDDLKVKMDACISHVIGTSAPATPDSGFFSSSPRISMSRSRGSSPSPRATYRSQRSNTRKTSTERSPLPEQIDVTVLLNNKKDEVLNDVIIKLQPPPQCERVKEAVENLDNMLDQKLREQQLIGKVIVQTKEPVSKAHIRRRFVTFTWQRGIKIGQGRFGKVYTAVNNHTGEMMAVKEIALQPNDKHAIQKIAEELKILEGILHPNLVKYYGLEVHREEMLLFMEFCSEGTLENLVAGTENGLPELLIRRYTFQLVNGVAELHAHGVVHRDIKTANIFLTDNGNCLKIGDFGCASKIRANTTMPGELQGFVGTQAYMAPEVFMKTSNEGHGRAADIWSVGCVVIEMASGKRPWAEYDSNYQIMFKVGMGEKPEAPEHLIDEGHDFLELCLQHNARDRATAAALLDHNFVKVGDDLT